MVSGPITTNAKGTLMILPISEIKTPGERVFFLELWKIGWTEKIWRRNLPPDPKSIFSPDGTIFAYIDIDPKDRPIFSIWKVEEEQVVRLATLDLSRFKKGTSWWHVFDATESYEFAISNGGRRIAFATEPATVQLTMGPDLRQTEYDGFQIDIVRLWAHCHLQYSNDDNEYLYMLPVTTSGKAIDLFVWHGPGNDRQKYTYPLSAKLVVADFQNWKVLRSYDPYYFWGPHLVIIAVKVRGNFQPKFRKMFGKPENATRLQVLYIEERTLKLVHSTTTYESIQMLSGRLFVDAQRHTVSRCPVPGESVCEVPSSIPILECYHNASNRGPGLEELGSDLPLGWKGKGLTCVDRYGSLVTVKLPQWEWFLTQIKNSAGAGWQWKLLLDVELDMDGWRVLGDQTDH
jgi:hypothetical protein